MWCSEMHSTRRSAATRDCATDETSWIWLACGNGLKKMANRSQHINPLVAIKLLHTLVWAIFAGSILALPIAAQLQRFNAAMILTVLIVAECGVLALNECRCHSPVWRRGSLWTERITSTYICRTGWHDTIRQFSERFSSSTNCSYCGAG